jgi:glutamate synthase (NADPH/NADH) small chain
MHGHDVTLYDGRKKAGGLNEFGIAAYKSTDEFAAREINWLMQIGGIEMVLGKRLGADLDLTKLSNDFDAVFLGIGLGGVNSLRADGEERDGVSDAVSFIADLRQAKDLSKLPVGRNVVVIGGGMTAVDAAVQSKLLGAENVTIAYRRGRAQMSASKYEQDLAASKGVRIVTHAQPKAVHGNGAATEVEFEYTTDESGTLAGTGETFRIAADQVFKAIGQTLDDAAGLTLEGGKIKVDAVGRTSQIGVWAGGDCATGGDDLTVTAVAEGRDAAEDIHAKLSSG